MLTDCRDLDHKQRLSCELCIVGAGAAGISIARSFLHSGHSVYLLESGGFRPDKTTQQLYRGWTKFNDEPEQEGYLHASRLRYFGGTTNHWAGLCRPLDPLDFKKREWVEYSGWPIDESDIESYYPKAAEIVELESFREDLKETEDCSSDIDFINSSSICSKTFYFSPPTRFGKKYRKQLVNAENINVLINANVLQIRLNKNGKSVKSVRCGTLGDTRFNVSARYYVLATGGVENARILLLSNDVQEDGIGNSYDQVGRYFMEHPQYHHAANIVLSDDQGGLSAFERVRDKKRFSVLAFTDEMQRKHKLLNTAMQIVTSRQNPRDILETGEVVRFFDDLRAGRRNGTEPHFAEIRLLSELNPDPSNRVFLHDQVDRLGLRKVKLEFRLTEQHINTLSKSLRLFATELAKASNGRLRINLQEDNPAQRGFYYSAYHHMGTTRMSNSPSTGVVNADCRIHGINNLFIAGSSVFPSAGFSNPTFMIVALALRLSDHIRRNLEREAT